MAAGRTGDRSQTARKRRQGVLQPQFPHRTDEPLRLQLPVLLLPASGRRPRSMGLYDGRNRTNRPRTAGKRHHRSAYRRRGTPRPRAGLLHRHDPPREVHTARDGRQGIYGDRTIVHDPQGGTDDAGGVAAAQAGRDGRHTGRRGGDIRRADPAADMSREGLDGRMARSARGGAPARHPDQRHDPLRACRGTPPPHRPPAAPQGTARPHGGGSTPSSRSNTAISATRCPKSAKCR